MSIFPGEIVDVVIKGVRVIGTNALTGAPTITDERGDEFPMPPQAAIERVAPPEWPPQARDVWRDRDGDLWLGVLVEDDDTADEQYVVLHPSRSSKDPGYDDLGDVLRYHGPLTLVRHEREGGEEQ